MAAAPEAGTAQAALEFFLEQLPGRKINGIIHPNTNAETYGRALSGLEPDTNVM